VLELSLIERGEVVMAGGAGIKALERFVRIQALGLGQYPLVAIDRLGSIIDLSF
jgi:hypothetical protein